MQFKSIHRSGMLRFLFLSIFGAIFAESCQVIKEPVESGCDYDVTLKLTSRPKGLIVQKENCSAEFVKIEWQDVPLLQMPSPDNEKTYTVIMIDPDAPSHEKGEYYLHWLVSNIRGEHLITGDLTTGGNTLAEYKGPGPVINTGLHRYIFLAFEEEKTNQKVTGSEGRRKFKLLPWLESQSEKLCGPVSGVQFRTGY